MSKAIDVGLSDRVNVRGRLMAFILATLVASGIPLIVAAMPANALSATCSAWKETKVQTGLDQHRAAAKCTSIGSGTKVRATLDRTGATDYHSSWFTVRNTTYRTAYGDRVAGCSARYDTAAR